MTDTRDEEPTAIPADAPTDTIRPARPTTVTAYKDGPLIIRGDVTFLDHDGVRLEPGRRTVALCRCGRSGLKPFCDGSHTAARFVSGPSAHRVEGTPDN